MRWNVSNCHCFSGPERVGMVLRSHRRERDPRRNRRQSLAAATGATTTKSQRRLCDGPVISVSSRYSRVLLYKIPLGDEESLLRASLAGDESEKGGKVAPTLDFGVSSLPRAAPRDAAPAIKEMDWRPKSSRRLSRPVAAGNGCNVGDGGLWCDVAARGRNGQMIGQRRLRVLAWMNKVGVRSSKTPVPRPQVETRLDPTGFGPRMSIRWASSSFPV